MDFRRKSANVLDEKYGRTDEKYAQVIGNIRYFSVSTSYRVVSFKIYRHCSMPHAETEQWGRRRVPPEARKMRPREGRTGC